DVLLMLILVSQLVEEAFLILMESRGNYSYERTQGAPFLLVCTSHTATSIEILTIDITSNTT
ncbi:13464_t:CDS:2, partial [Ambispora leptoticha]